MKQLICICCLIIGSIAFSSCDSNRVYEQYEKIPDYKWNVKNVLRFEVEITDTLSSHNLYLNVRNSGAYAYSNMWMFIKKTTPDGIVSEEKFECPLASEKGEWYGSGFGDIFDLQIPYQQNVIFPKSGIYVFEIVQGMREEELENVVNVGIRIEKAN
ncbi:gliding motility lipoprotein GldH [Marinifilum sp. RC60d5]|uniref:gliding motility lipoprotein GldH n=1 Tax=Marinifilum sp. RC60d5 TaxID=3458414 RepID=UPI0040369D24